MKINPFKLISFDSLYWEANNLYSVLNNNNNNTNDKIIKTKNIMEFLKYNISKGHAKIESSNGLYILQVSNEEKKVISIICEIDYDGKGVLFPNEETHCEKLMAYKNIFKQYKMQINPILTFYKNGPSIKSIVQNLIEKKPDILAEINKTKYELWKINSYIELQKIKTSLSYINKLYIADGHHRFSIFNDSQKKISAKIMVSITDSDSVLIKSCHRVLTTNIHKDWKRKISKCCIIEASKEGISNDNKVILKFRNGESYHIMFKEGYCNREEIHHTIKESVISESFGITDHQKHVFPIPGSLSHNDSSRIFDLYRDSFAIIFIPNLEISEFFKVIDNGKKLPASSTWFEPKIIDGFLIKAS